MAVDPLSVPPGSLTLEAITDLLAGGGGGAPGGSDMQLQYNNGGEFGGIAESIYVAGAGLNIGAPGCGIGLAGGPTEADDIAILAGSIEIQALESAATLAVEADSDIDVTSNNGGFNIAANRGSFNSNGLLEFISTAGAISFQSQLATPKYQFVGIPVFANNAAAIAGGLAAGDLYRTGANPDPVCVVH